jgi:very-short-patch-repair endonuclease
MNNLLGWEGEPLKKIIPVEIARSLRNNPTEAEKYLWYVLRLKNAGVKFRRQAVIGRYVVDFVCFERKLIVEVDGGQHADDQDDKVRDAWFKDQGYVILRFWNNDVLGNREEVLKIIKKQMEMPHITK